MIPQTFGNALSKYTGFLRLPFCRYRFPFIAGHAHLSEEQVASLGDLLSSGDPAEKEAVTRRYEEKLSALIGPGSGAGFASARMGFYCLMEELGIGKGDEVILPAFTCGVMPNAVLRRGATPVYVNISQETFGSDAGEIERKITPRTRLVVAQHLFGIPCEIDAIADTCRDKGVFLLEDSAPTLDSSFRGRTAGNWGDAAIFSSDHGKPLNTITGGLFYTRDRELYGKIAERSRQSPELDPVHQRNLFSRFLFERTYFNPGTYGRGVFLETIMRKYHKYVARAGTIVYLDRDYCDPGASRPVYPYPARMPAFLARLGLFELERWKTEKERRKALLKEYIARAGESQLSSFLPACYSDTRLDIVPLRFAFLHPDAGRLHPLMDRHISVIERLYPTVLTCRSLDRLGYVPGCCPVSEKIAAQILNWPCIVPPGWEKTLLDLFSGTFSAPPAGDAP
ncbi:MAG TPA: DegT/DnrJ/EryC1/StrS family aminotransferase [Methanoregula sp.]|nr:DegT/DnrJ/EryC1/StrS family aminotransferase [Methanoregula sp.]